MKRLLAPVLSAVLVCAFAQAALADTPTTQPSVSPAATQPAQAAPKAVDPADQIAAYVRGLEAKAAQANGLGPFYLSIYAPLCEKHGGFLPGPLDKAIQHPNGAAWPAVVSCRDNFQAKTPGPTP